MHRRISASAQQHTIANLHTAEVIGNSGPLPTIPWTFSRQAESQALLVSRHPALRPGHRSICRNAQSLPGRRVAARFLRRPAVLRSIRTGVRRDDKFLKDCRLEANFLKECRLKSRPGYKFLNAEPCYVGDFEEFLRWAISQKHGPASNAGPSPQA